MVQKIQDECKLEAARPQALPVDGGLSGQPCQAASGETSQSQKALVEPSGKGRGGGAREGSCTPLPTEHGSGAMRTEGRMPGCDDPVLSQGHVKSAGNSGMDENGDGLQRALEGELVEFLRNQNVKLMQELESLKGQLQSGTAKAGSGDASSPWSAVDGISAEGSGGNGIFHAERHGREGSRTPRPRTRGRAVSPEACEKGDVKSVHTKWDQSAKRSTAKWMSRWCHQSLRFQLQQVSRLWRGPVLSAICMIHVSQNRM